MNRSGRSGPWTTLELELLRRLFPARPAPDVARRLRRSLRTVRARARALFARRPAGPWSGDDDERLRASFGAIALADLAIVLGRSQRELLARVRELRGRIESRPWDVADERLLKRTYGGRPLAALEVCLLRPRAEIEAMAGRLRLGRDKRVRSGGRLRMPRWSAADVRRLRRLYPDRDNLEVAGALGRSVSSVANKASQLGLAKTAAARAALGRRNVRRRWGRSGVSSAEDCRRGGGGGFLGSVPAPALNPGARAGR